MRKQYLPVILTDPLFDDDIICVLFQKFQHSSQCCRSVLAYRIPLPRQIICIQSIWAYVAPMHSYISRTIHINMSDINICLPPSAHASRCVRPGPVAVGDIFVIIFRDNLVDLESSFPPRAQAATQTPPIFCSINSLGIALIVGRACASGAVYISRSFGYNEHATGSHIGVFARMMAFGRRVYDDCSIGFKCSSTLRARAPTAASSFGIAPINYPDRVPVGERTCTGRAVYGCCALSYGKRTICRGVNVALGIVDVMWMFVMSFDFFSDCDDALVLRTMRTMVRAGPRHGADRGGSISRLT